LKTQDNGKIYGVPHRKKLLQNVESERQKAGTKIKHFGKEGRFKYKHQL
jgi:hypothetical protein